MYEPNVRVTAKLMNSLKEIEEIRDLLKTIPILPIVENRIQQKALVETVHYTTRIEGNPLDIRAVERLGVRQPAKPAIQRDEQEVLNLYKATEFIRRFATRDDLPISEDVIKQIHAFVVRDIPKEGSPGIYRMKQNAIVDEATREIIYMRAEPSDVPRLMNSLSSWLTQRPLAFHPVIAAGIAHLELVAIHPFDNGNGRTARALADLILYRHGYELRYLFSWVAEAGINMDTYHRTLRQVLGTEYGVNVDPTIWLEYFAETVAKSLTKEKPELLRIREAFVTAYNIGEKIGLSRDQVEAILFASIYGEVTTGVYMKATRLSRSTVVKRLNHLVEMGVMQVEGKGRNVQYVVTTPETLTSKGQHR